MKAGPFQEEVRQSGFVSGQGVCLGNIRDGRPGGDSSCCGSTRRGWLADWRANISRDSLVVKIIRLDLVIEHL